MQAMEELIKLINGKKSLYFYGAGKVANRLRRYLESKNIRLSGYIVTSLDENPKEIQGCKVWEVSEFWKTKSDDSDFLVVIAVVGEQRKLFDTLIDLGLRNMVMLTSSMRNELNLWERQEQYNLSHEEYNIIYGYPQIEPNHLAVVRKEEKSALFRVPLYLEGDVLEAIEKKCRLDDFESLYGDFKRIPRGEKQLNTELMRAENIEIYVVTSHMDAQRPMAAVEEGLVPIQVGAALTKVRKGCISDDSGRNISAKNRDYCECTALYWIWKNTQGQDYVGLSHYRRRFLMEYESICYMKERNFDAVSVLPQFSPEGIKQYFLRFLCEHDWEYMVEAVVNYDGEYKQILEQYEQGHFFIPCNMVILKRSWFDRYCDFAFTVAENIEKKYEEKGIIREDRYMGYLFENLLSLFLIRYHEKLHTAYTDMEFRKA